MFVFHYLHQEETFEGLHLEKINKTSWHANLRFRIEGGGLNKNQLLNH